ncbi:hypothetical protein SAMN02745181_2364 [Rubritalea squalenifaciens DSM 18772]|uniref:Uncharacterized protein n=1 Tax=Rubritalea squalenifaciens DSM 18772 TaxID=1123071 RepID=A0A1M6LDB6_9BACT|nr:hypothetical protein [Rubritalea squalenifaciens]SHJ69128.1 hypothetical protein SAMN02745181_2364 [Rubritalea squalenifaciens DSM 18772]
MSQISITNIRSFIPALCRGDHLLLTRWLTKTPRQMLSSTIPLVILGCSSYGISMGLWQGWEMAAYVAIKLPLLIFFTLIVNGLINGFLAQVLDSGVSMRQSLQFLLSGFACMAIILGSLSPITIGMALQAPEPEAPNAQQYHSIILLTHVCLIAYAGIVSHLSLLAFLRHFATSTRAATTTFIAWIAGNLFVGAQISWILRPFFGSPGLEVAFLRDDPLQGTFYETVWRAAQNLIF